MSVQDGPLDGWRLYHVLGHMSRTKIRAAGLGLQLGLDVDALLEKNPFQERVLVPQHQTLVGSAAVRSLQVGEVGLMNADGLL